MTESEPVYTIQYDGCDCESQGSISASTKLTSIGEDTVNERLLVLSMRESGAPPYRCKMCKGRRFWPTKAQRWRKG